jgi:hypothetical protein
MKALTILFLLSVLTGSVLGDTLAPAVTEFNSVKYPELSGWKLGELQYFEDFNNLNDWHAEGSIDASIQDGSMKIKTWGTYPPDDNKGNVWSKTEFQGPYYFEWKFKEIDDQGLNLMYWGARTCDNQDFFSYKRDQDFNWMVHSNIESYHFSYSRGHTGWSNFRKNPGFHSIVPDNMVRDPLPGNDGKWHRVGIYQNQEHIQIYVDGKLLHEINENRDYGNCCLCFNSGVHKGYDVPNSCNGSSKCPGLNAKKVYLSSGGTYVDETGRRYKYEIVNPFKAYSYTNGRIGFRHQRGASLYDSLRVWNVVKASTRKIILNQNNLGNMEIGLYPNPFNREITISILRHNAEVKSQNAKVDIYDLSGKLLTSDLCIMHYALRPQVRWKAEGYPNGTYLVKLNAGSQQITSKVILNR